MTSDIQPTIIATDEKHEIHQQCYIIGVKQHKVVYQKYMKSKVVFG
jgi:hypothetical protein